MTQWRLSSDTALKMKGGGSVGDMKLMNPGEQGFLSRVRYSGLTLKSSHL